MWDIITFTFCYICRQLFKGWNKNISNAFHKGTKQGEHKPNIRIKMLYYSYIYSFIKYWKKLIQRVKNGHPPMGMDLS